MFGVASSAIITKFACSVLLTKGNYEQLGSSFFVAGSQRPIVISVDERMKCKENF